MASRDTADGISPPDAQAQQPKPAREYSAEHKRWIVRHRLQMQPLFDNKLHKNSQKWDDLIEDFYAAFPDQAHRKKESIQEQWNKAQHMFRDYSKTDSSFRAGRTSGLGRDQQETILNAKRGLCHDIFEEFHQGARPMSNPPTLFNGGNAEQLAAAAVAEGAAEETAAEKEEQEEEQEKEQEKEPEKEKEKEEEPEQDAGMTPVPCTQPSQLTRSVSPTSARADSPALSQAETGRKRQLSEADVDEMGTFFCNRSTRIGGVSKTPQSSQGSQSSGSESGTPAGKRGRKSAWEQFKALQTARAEERTERREERAAEKAAANSGTNSFMEMYVMMQHERAAEERKRETREAERQHKRDMQFMTMMAALINPAAAAGVAASAFTPQTDI